MAEERAYRIAFSREAAGHLMAIDRRHHSMIRRSIEEQLGRQPEQETRNRKPLTRPAASGAT